MVLGGKTTDDRVGGRGVPGRLKTFLMCASIGLFAASRASAGYIDFTSIVAEDQTINGAVFVVDPAQPSGTGVFESFLRIQDNGDEEGYNTSNPSLPFDEKPGPWTHDLLLGDIPIVTVGGERFYEFVLDIQEPAAPGKSLLSLDGIQIYTSPIGSQNTTNLTALGTLRYDLDALEDTYILLDAGNSSGSGGADLRALIPVSNFDGADASDFVYFFSEFGLNESSEGGFEEWGIVPEPGTALLMLIGLAGFSSLIRRRRR